MAVLHRLQATLEFLRLRALVDFWNTSIHPFLRVVLVLGFAGLVYLVGYGPVRAWRADNRLSEAMNAFEEGRYVDARELSLDVLKHGGDESRAYPILLRSCIELDSERQLEVASAMVFRDSLPERDRTLAWEVLCRCGSARDLLLDWARISASGVANETMAHALFDRLVRDGRPQEAARVLSGAPRSASDERLAKGLELLLAIGGKDELGELVDHVARLVFQRPEERERWLGYFDRVPFDSLEEERAITMVHALKAAPVEGMDVLRLCRCQCRLLPGRSETLIETALAETGEIAPDLRAAWCLDLGRADLAARMLPPLPPQAGLFKLQWEILQSLGDDERLREFLRQADGKMPHRWQDDLLREKLAVLEGRDKDAQKAGGEALRHALGSVVFEDPVELALLAEHFGLRETAAKAWLQAVVKRRGPLPLAQRLSGVLAFFVETADEDSLLSLLAALREIEPENRYVAAQHDYLACLQGRLDPAEMLSNIEALRSRQPAIQPLQTIATFGHLLLEDPDKAWETSEHPPREWGQAPPVDRAVRALALDAGGRSDEAQRMLDGVSWDSLLPSERRALTSLMGDRLFR
jgi:hypothetical protein